MEQGFSTDVLVVSFAGGLRLNRTAPISARAVFTSLVPEVRARGVEGGVLTLPRS